MNLKVGTLVEVDHKFSPDNLVGLIYEVYDDREFTGASGVSVLLEDGTDLGGFSFQEQLDYLTKIKDTSFNYHFTNYKKFFQDIKQGLFKEVFKQK